MSKTMKIFAAGVLLAAAQGTASAQSLWSLYQPACGSMGIDDDQCLCILGQVSDSHGDDAARYLALDMNMRHDEAAMLLEKIGEDEAFAVGMTFDQAQNLSCSSSRLAQLAGSYQGDGSGEASSAAIAGEESHETTLADMVAAPLQVLRGPSPYLDLSAIEGDVEVIISVVMQSDLVKANTGGNVRPHLGWYQIADEAGGVDVSGDGVADVATGDPAYASTVQARVLSPKMYLPSRAGAEQVVGQMRLKGGAMYAPVMRVKAPNQPSGPVSMGDLAKITSVEELTRQMSAPRHLQFAFPVGEGATAGALRTVDETSFAYSAGDVNADGAATSRDALVVINVLNRPAAD